MQYNSVIPELFNNELGDWATFLNDKEFADVVDQYCNPEVLSQYYPTAEEQQYQQQLIIEEGTVPQNVYPNWGYDDASASQPIADSPPDLFRVFDGPYPAGYPMYISPSELPMSLPLPNESTPPRPRRQTSPQKRKRDEEEDEFEEKNGDDDDDRLNPTSPPPKKKYYKKKNVPLKSVEELEVSPEITLAITEIRGKYGKDLYSVNLATFDNYSWRATLSRKKNCVVVRSAIALPALQLKVEHVSSIRYFDVCITVGEVKHVDCQNGDHIYYLNFDLKSTINFDMKRSLEGTKGKRGCAIPLYEVRFDVCDLNGVCYCSFTGGVKRRAK